MRVIERGPGWVVKCSGAGNNSKGCGATLEAMPADMRYSAGGGYMDRDPAVSVRCPACGVITDLPRKDWPNHKTLAPYTGEWALGKETPAEAGAKS